MNIILVVFGHGIKSLELGNFMVEWGLCVNIYIYIYVHAYIRGQNDSITDVWPCVFSAAHFNDVQTLLLQNLS